jgi:aminoglycoside/choline kinase family phosphotransferase
LELIRDDHFWEHPLLRSAFPRPITNDVLRLWSQHETLLSTLDHLPRTFCHMDAYRPNLFLRRSAQDANQLVAIDWVFAGIGAIGEEIANLLAASLIWFEYDATEAKGLDEAIFAGYLGGLREAGWHGDAQLVRLGYTFACALRWGW